jgi:hypothetical protein
MISAQAKNKANLRFSQHYGSEEGPFRIWNPRQHSAGVSQHLTPSLEQRIRDVRFQGRRPGIPCPWVPTFIPVPACHGTERPCHVGRLPAERCCKVTWQTMAIKQPRRSCSFFSGKPRKPGSPPIWPFKRAIPATQNPSSPQSPLPAGPPQSAGSPQTAGGT